MQKRTNNSEREEPASFGQQILLSLELKSYPAYLRQFRLIRKYPSLTLRNPAASSWLGPSHFACKTAIFLCIISSLILSLQDNFGSHSIFSPLDAEVESETKSLNDSLAIQKELEAADPQSFNRQVVAFNAKLSSFQKDRPSMGPAEAQTKAQELNHELAEIETRMAQIGPSHVSPEAKQYWGMPNVLADEIRDKTQSLNEIRADDEGFRKAFEHIERLLELVYPPIFLLFAGIFVRISNLGWKNKRISTGILRRFYLYQMSSIFAMTNLTWSFVWLSGVLVINVFHNSHWQLEHIENVASLFSFFVSIALLYSTIKRWNRKGMEQLRPLRIWVSWTTTAFIIGVLLLVMVIPISMVYLKYQYPSVYDRLSESWQDFPDS